MIPWAAFVRTGDMVEASSATGGSAPLPKLGLRVLIADDNAANRVLTERFLDLLGCTWLSVGSGREAIAAVEEHSFDVVLMDCQMPDVDGYQATVTIRALEQDRRTPIVALTAAAYPEDLERSEQAGMDGHITKPFLVGKLVEVLGRFGPGLSR